MENNIEKAQDKNELVGLLYGVLAFTVWGLMPIYWKLLKQIPSEEILAHRILWSFVFVSVIAALKGKMGEVKKNLKDRKNIKNLVLSAIFISINWGLFIWAVNSDNIIESSMGYYINPIMVITLAMTVLKERLNRMQYISIAFATIGVIIITVQYGKIPWISLLLAASFAMYGLFKKLMKTEPLLGLVLETAILAPIALIYLVYKLINGTSGLYIITVPTMFALLFVGVLTAVPLLWYAMGAKKARLSTIGFCQYISPSISLCLGVLVYGEKFTKTHLISFGFIWTALVIYSISNFGAANKIHKSSEEKVA